MSGWLPYGTSCSVRHSPRCCRGACADYVMNIYSRYILGKAGHPSPGRGWAPSNQFKARGAKTKVFGEGILPQGHNQNSRHFPATWPAFQAGTGRSPQSMPWTARQSARRIRGFRTHSANPRSKRFFLQRGTWLACTMWQVYAGRICTESAQTFSLQHSLNKSAPALSPQLARCVRSRK